MKASSFTKSRRRLSWSRSRMNSSPILWTINAFIKHHLHFLLFFYHKVGPNSSCVVADLSDDLCQTWVAHNQPAARSDAVGLVLELVRLHFIKVLKTESRGNMLVTFRKKKKNIYIQRRIRDIEQNKIFLSSDFFLNSFSRLRFLTLIPDFFPPRNFFLIILTILSESLFFSELEKCHNSEFNLRILT